MEEQSQRAPTEIVGCCAPRGPRKGEIGHSAREAAAYLVFGASARVEEALDRPGRLSNGVPQDADAGASNLAEGAPEHALVALPAWEVASAAASTATLTDVEPDAYDGADVAKV